MRIFYIFQINTNIKKMTQESPYNLFHTLETIYYRSPEDVELSYLFLKQLIIPIDLKNLDIALFKRFKENYFYTKYKNVHKMHDVYRQENTTLTLYKTYMKMETNVIKPRFLEIIRQKKNIFICDFEEKDYFWLESLSSVGV